MITITEQEHCLVVDGMMTEITIGRRKIHDLHLKSIDQNKFILSLQERIKELEGDKNKKQ